MPKLFCLTVLIATIVAACAPPAPDSPQEFVPREDLVTVALFREGLSLYGQSRFADAELKFRQALYIFPEAKNAKLNLAHTLVKQAAYPEALAIYSALLDKSPDEPELLIGLAELYYAALDFGQATHYFTQVLNGALERNEMALAARMARNLSILNFRAGNEEDALCYSENALAWDRNPDQINRHARLLVALGQGQKAKGLIEEFIGTTERKRDPQLLYVLSIANFSINDYKGALEKVTESAEQGGRERGLELQISLVKTLAHHALPEEPKAPDVEESEEDDPEKKAAMRESLDRELAISTVALYLPPNLLDLFKVMMHGHEQTAA